MTTSGIELTTFWLVTEYGRYSNRIGWYGVDSIVSGYSFT
jgi:hypothetical protein